MLPKVLLALLLGLPLAVQAQPSEQAIKSHLSGKALFLRGLWFKDNLRFDATGRLQTPSITIPFTLCGFDLKTITLSPDKLVLDGRRTGVAFIKGKPHSLALNAGEGGRHEDEHVHIEIAADPSGDYLAALDVVFAYGIADLASSLPDYWQTFVQGLSTPPVNQAASVTVPTPPRTGPGSVKPPELVNRVDPEYSIDAANLHYRGAVRLTLSVATDGLPTEVSIVDPAGIGLDEQALEAVRQYRFKPAMKDGAPTQVKLNIVLSFN